jgi:riboflavin kinase/FMN adenylyltransferase
MRLIRGLAGLRAPAAHSVLSIGAYDGLHLGHQALLARLIERAAGAAAPAGLGS